MKDRNSHNFGIFNKAYDLALSMNKANGYMLSGGGGGGGGNGAGGGSSHPNNNSNNSSQGHVEVTGDVGGAAGVNGGELDEPQSDASNHEESSVINSSANGGGGRDNNNGNISNLQPQQV